MKMNKRTKIEIVIIIIAAIIYFAGMITGRGSANDINVVSTQAVVESQAAAQIVNSNSTEISQTSTAVESIAESDAGGETETAVETPEAETEEETGGIQEDGEYTDKDSVALYIYTFGHLPDNYVTKNEARDAGWVSEKGNLPEVCPGKSIGGDKFSNYEGNLPTKKGRKYFECDINYDQNKGRRGAERIIYSNDGLIYYTGDHYKSFELLYGEP